MLASSGNVPRLVSCATDRARHDRMRDLTDSNYLALTEIRTTRHLISFQIDYQHALDLDSSFTSLALLSVQEDHLTEGIYYEWFSGGQAWWLAGRVEAVAASGDHDRAEALTMQITNPCWKAWLLAGIVEAAATGGDHDRAAWLASMAEGSAECIANPGVRAWILAWLVMAVAAGGDHGRAARLASDAQTLTEQITDPQRRAEALTRLVSVPVEIRKETSSVPETAGNSSPPAVRARHCLASALLIGGSWTRVVARLMRVDPALADADVMWGIEDFHPLSPKSRRHVR
jgi:hypothetical protein